MAVRLRTTASVLAFMLMLAVILPRPALAQESSMDAAAADEAKVSAAAPGTRVVTVEVQVKVENRSTDPTEDVVVTLPPAILDKAGTQEVLGVDFGTKPAATRTTTAGTEATYKFARVAPGESHLITQTYTIALAENAAPIIEKTIDPRYLSPEPGIESDNTVISAKATEVTKGLKTADAKAEALVRFVSRYLTYDLTSNSRNRGALAGFTTRSGVCSEYAGLFVAMSRAAGVPARLVYGWARSSGLNGALDYKNRHVWAEYYSGEHGWIQVDPTFAIVLPDDQVMYFDGFNHVAQDRIQTATSSSYSGLGWLAVLTSYRLDQPVSQLASSATN